MKTAKIFQSGNSQAVRIPKEFKLEGDKVEIQKRRNALVLSPTKRSWAVLIETDPSREGAARHAEVVH